MNPNYPGLTSAEANQTLLTDGLNQVKNNQDSWFKIFLGEFKSPIVYLLIVSALISFVSGDGFDGLVISAIILINLGIGFTQDFQANNLAQKLQSFIKFQSIVIRDGIESKIDSQNIVKGDLIKLKLGEIVPADCCIIDAQNLTVDESAITGESIGVEKLKEATLFSGSNIAAGNCLAVVTATGSKSQFGQISALAMNTKKVSEFNRSMSQLSRGFLIVGVAFFIVIFGMQIILGKVDNFSASLLFILALTISIVPEALPVITSLALAGKSLELAKKGLLIKHQTTLEDLGNMDILCSDKTGTLTQNKMDLVEISPFQNAQVLEIAAVLAKSETDALDKATIAYVHEKQLNLNNTNLDLGDLVHDIPFDPVTRLSGMVFDKCTLWRGSPEELISKTNLDQTQKTQIIQEIQTNEDQGRRGICFAKETDNKMEFFGTLYFADELKSNAHELIEKCREANVQLKIITGDSLKVASFIGQKAGLIMDSSGAILAGDLLFENPELLLIQLKTHSVFARCNPVQKYKIIQALQKHYVIGYLGDGINDAPSLKLAQASIVVDTASDIAKSSSDIIMTNSDLTVLIEAIRDGRIVYENINKYTKLSLAGNFGNFFTIGLLSLILNFPPMLAVQILLANLITDIPLLNLSVDNVAPDEVRKPKHQVISRLLLLTVILGLVSSIFDFIFFAFYKHYDPTIIQTSWFAFSIFTELLLLFSIRTKKPFWQGDKVKLLVFFASTAAFLITVFMALVGFQWIKIQTINLTQIVGIALLALTYVLVSEICKVIYYRIYTTEVD